MKFIKTDEITDDVGVFITKKYHDFVSDMQTFDKYAIFATALLNQSQNEVWQIISMNFQNPSGSDWTWSASTVMFEQKFYQVLGGSLTLGLGEFMVYYFIDTPINETFSDGTSKPFLINRTIGIRKNTEGAYIQSVDILRYCSLEKRETIGNMSYVLSKKGNVWNLFVIGSTNGTNIWTLLKNFNGSASNTNYTPPVIFHFGYYEFANTTEFNRGVLQKNGNNDLILNLNTTSLGTGFNFSVSWVQ